MSETATVNIRTRVELPKPPNFLRIAGTAEAVVDVSALTEAELRTLGAAWTEALVANAKRRASK